MAVRAPATSAHIHFHIAHTRGVIANLNHCAAKIRSAFGAGKTGVKNLHYLAIGSFELVTAQALMQPDGLQQAFGGQVSFIAQDIGRAQPRTPSSVKILGRREHLEIAFAPTTGQSQASV
jgi:hypothetical protein